MALERGYEPSGVEGARNRRGPRVFWIPNGKETTIVLLDDEPVKVCRHRYYLRGDRDANDLRQTCAGMNPSEHKAACPRICIVCNAAIRHNEIKRQELFYLSLIDERKFEKNGKEFSDQKLFLEMSDDQVDLFRDRKKSKGKLVGARFRVYRGKDKTSDRLGSSWDFIDFVEPVRHFWQSPAIGKIMEAERKKDPTKCPADRTEHYKRVAYDLVRPFDYENLIGKYNVDEADAFIAVVVSPDRAKAATGDGAGTGGSGDVPPPPPPGTAPNYAMPPGAAPAYPGAPPPSNAPAPQPQQGYAPPPPPPVADPRTATAPAGGGNAPPPPWEGQQTIPGAPGYVPPPATAPAPQGFQAPPPPPAGAVPSGQAQTHGFAPPPMPGAGAPPPPQASAPAGSPAPGAPRPGYDFSQGWSAQPPGMGQPPAPATTPAPARSGARESDI
jgi:hypothetical protein